MNNSISNEGPTQSLPVSQAEPSRSSTIGVLQPLNIMNTGVRVERSSEEVRTVTQNVDMGQSNLEVMLRPMRILSSGSTQVKYQLLVPLNLEPSVSQGAFSTHNHQDFDLNQSVPEELEILFDNMASGSSCDRLDVQVNAPST
ncbi:hypothetical protein H0H87_010749 [Tephrocybe sp. NHM501043]|nr:hypothetical protein H0H87_010749 [Tephrocybe sp. NHM501043]